MYLVYTKIDFFLGVFLFVENIPHTVKTRVIREGKKDQGC
jgi:hypothetical protein